MGPEPKHFVGSEPCQVLLNIFFGSKATPIRNIGNLLDTYPQGAVLRIRICMDPAKSETEDK